MSEPRGEWSAERIAHTLGQPPPTAEQKFVIEAPLGPMLVVAGAGSGKTETMAARVVYLVANGITAPGEILGLTFTRKAAAELSGRIRARLRRLHQAGVSVGDIAADRPRIATYNSYAAAIVADHALRLGIDPDATLIGDAGRYQLAEAVVNSWDETVDTPSAVVTVIDAVVALAGELAEHGRSTAEAAGVIEQILEEITEKEIEPGSRAKGPSQAAQDICVSLRTRQQLMKLVDAFAERKRDHGVVDFGDQVRIAATVAEHVADVGEAERSRYRVVLLDEYQDTSIAQVQLLRALFDGGHPVTAVGDPNQAIYGWRGAAAGTLLAFPDVFTTADGARAPITNLSTAWRNDLAILRAANVVARPLLTEGVAELHPRPGAAEGAVHARYPETSAEEAELVASFLQRHWSLESSAAVLCRRRAQFPLIENAIRAAGLPVQVVGLAGLLVTAEVADVRAALQVAHDPTRGDALMRLLTGPSVNLGATDVRVLAEWARHQARSWLGADPQSGREADPAEVLEPAEQASLVEAMDQLPPPDWRTTEGRQLSDPARDRLARLAEQIRLVRSLTHLGIPELVTAVEQALDLDIEVLAASTGSAGHARRHLDAFTAAAADFSRDSDTPSLGAFLTYLDVAEDEERGLEVVEAEPDPHAVQVMTVHAAKGLEWDCVVVVGMNVGDFPSFNPVPAPEKPFKGSGWLKDIKTLPYELRGDRDSLPELDLAASVTHKDVENTIEEFRLAEGSRLLNEERRLAYVALTRARHNLLLTGSFWGDRKTVSRPAPFLEEVLRADLAHTGAPWPQQSAHLENPTTVEARTALWPAPRAEVDPSWWQVWAGAQEGAKAPQVPTRAPGISDEGDRWWRDALLLLGEREQAVAAPVPPPAHLSASAVVALAQDAEEFQRIRRRPVPTRPSVHARRGTRFHAWVEHHFGSRALIDWDSLPGADDDLSGVDPEFDELRRMFLASEWAGRSPIAVETDIETPVRGVMIRCRIDAVFANDQGIHIVDWKTGAPPCGESATRARQMQLALYRIAWSKLHHAPLEHVRASFYYVADGVTVSGDDINESEIEDLIAKSLL